MINKEKELKTINKMKFLKEILYYESYLSK